MSKKKKKKLIPADPRQCQAMIRPGSFMTLGPRYWERCKNKPSAILWQTKPGEDGLRGSMSVCADCLEQYKAMTPNWKKEVAVIEICPA